MEEDKTKGAIILDNHYAITVEPIDYALAKIKYTKSGEMYFKRFAYYGSVAKCLRKYVQESVHSDLDAKGYISLNEALNTIETAVKRCETVIKQTLPGYEVIKTD